MKPKDKKSVIFYFLMSIVLLDFGRQIRIISYNIVVIFGSQQYFYEDRVKFIGTVVDR